MITSTSNSRIKYVIQLQNRSKARREHKRFVAEGHKMVAEAPKDRLYRIYAAESFADGNPLYMRDLNFPYETVSDSVFAQMSDTRSPQGILAVVDMLEYDIDGMLKTPDPMLMILEDLQDPGNLGTIVRTAECAGVSGIIMSPDTVDIYNPKVIRSTMGSLYRVPFLYAADFYDTLELLNDRGIILNAAHLEGSVEYTNADYRGPCAFLIGNEGRGLTDKTTAIAVRRVRIPMSGQAESLNAAVAASILLFEARRQRSAAKSGKL